nr:MAG TPA: hypothetical protein [Caudoviricetes sp.]
MHCSVVITLLRKQMNILNVQIVTLLHGVLNISLSNVKQ